MKRTLISGSQSVYSQSLNVVNYLKGLAEPHFNQIEILDLGAWDLPFCNEGVR
ncbi:MULTISPECIES: NAD(P)H-dependent oxidoreductase [unclassified Vibrio]|uniref:NAD(P)H-dependent oxidoreductase n=1 Tax=unclassified Vibrio TaxID=2614977 RepID=UPI0020169CEC|nr:MULTISPECIES: NAD(P)H-dependent oxidoreductase [unclassified Vibrio]